MNYRTLPAAGTLVLVTLPHPYARVDAPARYTVADVRGRQLTLLCEEQFGAPDPPSGVPCLVGTIDIDGRRSSCEAVVVASGASMVIVDVVPDPRQHPRYRRACKVRLEVPDSDLGVIDGVLEDLSAGGLRVHSPVVIPVDQRVFVSVLFADTHGVLAIAEVRGVQRGRTEGDFVMRLQFTLMAPSHRARLAALLEWPVVEPGAGDEFGEPGVALTAVT
ncbi:MAG TPA: PilZ domain-containing protein [Acidimicrobiales bacterium]|nr:PilZ domain-containing protein [Acidimicrobiales bacterium]